MSRKLGSLDTFPNYLNDNCTKSFLKLLRCPRIRTVRMTQVNVVVADDDAVVADNANVGGGGDVASVVVAAVVLVAGRKNDENSDDV